MAYTTIKKPSDYFDTTTYTGGATDVSSLSFQPDFVWAKKRDGAENHGLFDAVRGATKTLNSNTTSAESTRSGSLTSFDSDGWSMGGSDGIISASGSTYVAWSWSGAGNSGSANTDGDIASTVSANTTSEFSIVSYTGNGVDLSTTPQTVGHGLSGVSMVIIKNLSQSIYWIVKQKDLSSNKVLYLNDSSAETTPTGGNQGHIGNLSSSGTTFELVSNSSNVDNVNVNGNNYIAYCFAEKQGYSKFGSYVGNGSTDGTFIYTGFKPAFVMTKNITAGSTDWTVCDSKRDGFNDNNKRLFPNQNSAESGSNPWQMYSNGFKITTTGSFVNTSGDNFIYMAFAEQPLVGDNPATAR